MVGIASFLIGLVSSNKLEKVPEKPRFEDMKNYFMAEFKKLGIKPLEVMKPR